MNCSERKHFYLFLRPPVHVGVASVEGHTRVQRRYYMNGTDTDQRGRLGPFQPNLGTVRDISNGF